MNRHARRTHVLAIALAAVVGLGGAACSSGGGATATAPANIAIKNFAFTPSPATLKTGQTVRVRNNDDTTHTFTADDGSFDSGPIAGGTTASVAPRHAGDIHYHCSIHTYMTGTLHISG